MKSAITICLVEEARRGPFVLHDGLAQGCKRAGELGFHAVEIFPPHAKAVDVKELKHLLKKHNLKVAAFGTGAGWLREGLSLTAASPAIRQKAIAFIRGIIELGNKFKAPAIIGSMQGRIEGKTTREQALKRLADGLRTLSELSSKGNVPLLYEPLNRYETNVFNRIAETAEWLDSQSLSNVKILADMFHMNIEESDLVEAIRKGGERIGHVHFADSNRLAVGLGHTEVKPIVTALKRIDYEGYLSAEIFPLPDPDIAAVQTLKSFQRINQPSRLWS